MAPVVNSYTYNKRRLLTGESVRHADGTLWSVGYGYNSAGILTSHTYPSGLVVDYATNGLGQATKVGSFASGLQYYPNGALKQFTYGNGIVHTMTQNARQLPARSTDGNALDLAYAFDANANVSQILDYVQGTGFNRAMQYDGLDRLVTASSNMFGGDGVYRYTYDGLDNLRSARLAGIRDHTYWYDASNRLINVKDGAGATVVGLAYDVQGNLANKNGQAYAFDYGNRLRQATGKEAYAYDGHGRRVLNTRPDGTRTVSQYSQQGQLLYQENTSKGVAIDHVYLAGSLVAARERNTKTNAIATKYQHTDALGSPVAVTNEAAQVIERTHYEPYGASIGKAVDGVGYTGHVMDAATGLTYMQQRYYDPLVGRFLSVDPVAADASTGANFNVYKYTNNNPYRFTDPDGRQEHEVDNRSMAAHKSLLSGAGAIGSARSLGGGALSSAAVPRPGPGMPLPVPGENVGKALAEGADALAKRISKQLERIEKKPEGPNAEQYALVAIYDGRYPSVRGGTVDLNAGDVYKYGQTTDPKGRYSATQLRAAGLRYETQFVGSQRGALIIEKTKLFEHFLENGTLPPGNRVFK